MSAATKASSLTLPARTVLFGNPSAEAEAALNALSDVRQLEKLAVRLLCVSNWEELLGLNGSGRRGRSRKKKE